MLIAPISPLSAMEDQLFKKAHDDTLRPILSTYCQRLLVGVECAAAKYSDLSKNENVLIRRKLRPIQNRIKSLTVN